MIFTEHMHIDPVYRERLQACGLNSVQRVLTCVDGRIAAWSRTTDTLYVSGGDVPGFYVKRHFFPTWTKRLRGMFRGTFFGMHRGQAEYRALNQMRFLGIPAVRAVAYGGRRVGHFLTACFLITEEVPGGENLTTVASEIAGGRRTITSSQRRLLLTTLAEQLATMHRAGCTHGNLFWRNLLVRAGPDGRPEYFFLDAQPLRPWERVGPGVTGWLRELAQAQVSAQPFTSRSERLRFVREYLGVRRLTAELRAQLRRIDQLACLWRRHEARRIHMNRLFNEWNQQLAAEVREGGYGTRPSWAAEQPS